jgi:hypothetical protein
VVRSFLSRDGAVQVADEVELERVLGELLAKTARCAELGRNALAVVQENLGAIESTVDMIVEHLDGSELYVAPKRQVLPPEQFDGPVTGEA